MGIYDSRKSVWQRHKEGKSPDHAGRGVIGEVVGDDKVVKQPLNEETVEKVEEEPKKKSSKKSYTKKSYTKKSSETD